MSIDVVGGATLTGANLTDPAVDAWSNVESRISVPGDMTIEVKCTDYSLDHLPDNECQITAPGFVSSGDGGNPALPGQLLRFALPSDTDLATVSLTVDSRHEVAVPGVFSIAPVPTSAADLGDGTILLGTSNLVDGKNMLVYGQDAEFGPLGCTLVSAQQMGRWKIAEVYYSPFAYNPVAGSVRVADAMTLSLHYTTGDVLAAPLALSTAWDASAADTLVNFSEPALGYTTASASAGDVVPIASATANYVIITTSAIQSNSTQLANFVTHQQGRGYTVAVKTESDWGGGTGNTAAENIRTWLKNNYASLGIQYVLLIGNPNPSSGDVPMKMTYPRLGATDGYAESPTDYYYADLTSNWNADGDAYYGVWGTGKDFTSKPLAEVVVGRIPVYSAAYSTLDSILYKTIAYEDATSIAWRKNMLLPMAISNYANEGASGWSRTDGSSLAEYIKTDLATPNSFGTWRMYETAGLTPVTTACDQAVTESNVTTRWASNTYGIVDWWAHGSQQSASRKYWNVDTDADGVPDAAEMTWPALFTSSDTTSLSNTYPSIVTQVSCTNGYPEDSNNLGYALLKNGAIATYSASRVSWYAIGSWSPSLGTAYGDNASYAYYITKRLVQNQSTETTGAALQWARENLGTGFAAESWMNCTDFNLLGDPTILAFASGGVAPGTPDLVAASDAGASSSDNITNLDNSIGAKTLQFSVSGTVSGATVTIYADGTAIGSAVATGTTTTVTTNGSLDLTDGTHAITARQTEPAKLESSDSAALSVSIDTTAPTGSAPDLNAASDTGSSSSDNITQGTAPQFDGSASDSGTGVWKVVVTSDDGKTATDATSPFFSATLATLDQGTRTVTAAVYDVAGNSYVTSSLSLTVDRTSPTVTINQATSQTDPTSNVPTHFTVVFSDPVSGFTTGDVTLSGTANAAVATITGSGTTYDAAVYGMTNSGTIIGALAAGVAQDVAGNGNSASTSTDNTITYDVSSLTTSVRITEFLAANSKGIKDAAGTASDWIEIYNPDSLRAVDMTGWKLKYGSSTTWKFPSVALGDPAPLILGPGEFRILFCEGVADTGYRDPNGELHTTFNLSKDGKKLQLLNASDVVVSSWNPYAAQTDDISYGVGQEVTETKLVGSGATAKYYVPASASLGTTWTQQTGFDDSLWTSGTTGLGYANLTAGFNVTVYKSNISLIHLDTAQSVIDTSAYQTWSASETASRINYYNTGGQGNITTDQTVFPGTVAGIAQTEFVLKANGVVHIPSAGNWTFCISSDDGFRMSIGSDVFQYDGIRTQANSFRTVNFVAAGDYDMGLLFFQHTATAELEVSVAPGAKTVWDTSFKLLGDVTGNYPSVKSVPLNSTASSTGSFASQISTDVGSAMAGVTNSTSLYARIPFTVDTATLASLQSLTLKMKYDDGYVAYLNGTKIASRNAPTTPAYNSVATASRTSDLQCTTFETIDVTAYLNLLSTTSTNILAIQVMKSSTSDTDLLVVPELSQIVSTQLDEHFFATPTPGKANTQDTWKADVAFSVAHGFYDAPIQLTLTSGIASADIWYTTDETDPVAPNIAKSVAASGSAVSVTGITYNATTAIATVANHGFVIGQTVTISGATPALYNGTFVITGVTQSTFTYTMTGTPTLDASGTITVQTCGIVLNGTTATVTLANHGYAVGNIVAISGATQATYNGVFTITGVTTSTFTYTMAAGAASPATGTISALKVDKAITGIAHSGTTATVTATNHGFYVGEFIRITGASPSEYNGDFVIVSVVGSNTFTYTMASTPATDASGTMGATRVSHKYTGPLTINTTTTVRAASAPSGGTVGISLTESYIFINDVINQSSTPTGFPTDWTGTASGTVTTPADYAMDTRITTGATAQAEIRAGLLSLPTMSIVMSKANLFDTSYGIYSNSQVTDNNSPVSGGSLEYIDPDSSDTFQINAAFRMYGNVGRNATYKKHSFRINFKAPYGPSKLEFPLFDDPSATQEFDTILLKSLFNDCWTWGGTNVQYIRDANTAMAQLAMGDASHHVDFVNLYIDGLYWGVYCLTERPDTSFDSTYFGGDDSEWEGINDGWRYSTMGRWTRGTR